MKQEITLVTETAHELIVKFTRPIELQQLEGVLKARCDRGIGVFATPDGNIKIQHTEEGEVIKTVLGIDPPEDIDAEFSESTVPAHLEAIRQEHEPFLTKLEALAVLAIASGDWMSVYVHVEQFWRNRPSKEELVQRLNVGDKVRNPNTQTILTVVFAETLPWGRMVEVKTSPDIDPVNREEHYMPEQYFIEKGYTKVEE